MTPPRALAAAAIACAVLVLAGCGQAKYAGPDWRLSDEWVPLAGPPGPPADNALPPRALYQGATWPDRGGRPWSNQGVRP